MDAIIIGKGPAGISAAVYLRRANLDVTVIGKDFGALGQAQLIENYYGFDRPLTGLELAEAGQRQAERLGIPVRTEEVTAIEADGEFTVRTTQGAYRARAVLLATGKARREPELENFAALKGKGISFCAVCDGFFYRKKDVAVVGGGDTACEEATYLASICRKVYMIVRKPHLRASKAMQERVFNTTNIEVMFNHNTAEVLGDESGVTGALLRCNDGKEVRIDIAGFFLAIGHHPNTELFADQLTLDAEGYIKTEAGTSKTNIEGVFAAGDVRDPHYRQAITAAASGCIAAIDCDRFILSRAE